MPVDRQRHRDLLFLEDRRLIQQRGDPQPGDRFVTQLFDRVAGAAGNRLAPNGPRRQIAPMGCLAAKDGPLERLAAGSRGIPLPLGDRAGLGHGRTMAPNEIGHFLQRNDRLEQVPIERVGHRLDVAGRPAGLGPMVRRDRQPNGQGSARCEKNLDRSSPHGSPHFGSFDRTSPVIWAGPTRTRVSGGNVLTSSARSADYRTRSLTSGQSAATPCQTARPTHMFK